MTAPIEPGQRWRRKSDGVEVEVVRTSPSLVEVTNGLYVRFRPVVTWHARYDLIAEDPR